MVKKMIEICFLGTGGSVATKERDNTSFLIRYEEGLVLVDCPGSVFQKIKRFDFDPRDVTTILMTHTHPDHVYGLPSLVHSLMLDEGIIRLFGSAETIDFCKDLLDLFRLREKKIKTRVDLIPLKSRENFRLSSSLSCLPIKVPHNPSSLAFHLSFEREGKDLVYSGDTPCFPPLFDTAAGKDYLIHDCSAPLRFFEEYPSLSTLHTHSLELGGQAQKCGVKCLIPCHFFGELDFSLQEVEEEIRKNYTGRLVIPQDLERITL